LYINYNLSEHYKNGIDEYFYRHGIRALVLDKIQTELSNNFIMLPLYYVINCFEKLQLRYDKKRLFCESAFHLDTFILCDAIGIPDSPHKTYYAVQKVINHYKREHNTPSAAETNQSIFLGYALKVFFC
jgi:hypothetical protein